ncbi:MAG TPA: FAD-dependent oxidoreductase [Bacteroidia bacterium]|nr:FAD-dependent oxidoreductase [Bacteroidia bacterium]
MHWYLIKVRDHKLTVTQLREIEYLISGQGLAGSLLAWQLLKEGKKVMVVDEDLEFTSTKVASGMMHPITGRRIVLSWRADEFVPFARKTFKEIENATGVRFFFDMPVFEIYHDHGNRNDWIARSAQGKFKDYLGEECEAKDVHENVNAPFGGQWLINSGWLDAGFFVEAMKEYLKANNSYCSGRISEAAQIKTDKGYCFEDIIAEKFVSCIGYQAIFDDNWKYLPFNPAKGEEIAFTAEGNLPSDYIIHDSIKIIPIGEQKYRCGATYAWKDFTPTPTAEGLAKLKEGIASLIKVPYKVTAQRAGIRPATFDRRPFLGKHPEKENLYIFNGLGSKGVMMGPLLGYEMMKFLVYGEEILPEYDIKRFNDAYYSSFATR